MLCQWTCDTVLYMWGFAEVILGLQRFMFCQITEIHTSTMLSSYLSYIYSFCKLSLLLGVLRGPAHPMSFTLNGVLGSGAGTGFPPLTSGISSTW